MARHRGYASLQEYVSFFRLALLHDWFSNGQSLQGLLQIKVQPACSSPDKRKSVGCLTCWPGCCARLWAASCKAQRDDCNWAGRLSGCPRLIGWHTAACMQDLILPLQPGGSAGSGALPPELVARLLPAMLMLLPQEEREPQLQQLALHCREMPLVSCSCLGVVVACSVRLQDARAAAS